MLSKSLPVKCIANVVLGVGPFQGLAEALVGYPHSQYHLHHLPLSNSKMKVTSPKIRSLRVSSFLASAHPNLGGGVSLPVIEEFCSGANQA